MDVENILLENLSRKMVDMMVQTIGSQPELFIQLYPLAFSDSKKIAWRAAWVLSHVHEHEPELFDDKLQEIMQQVLQTPFEGVRRSFISILANSTPEHYSVEFINACFDWMLSPKQPIAIQVYCMRVLLNVCRQMPDFKPELQVCLENADSNDYSKGFSASRRKVLLALSKL